MFFIRSHKKGTQIRHLFRKKKTDYKRQVKEFYIDENGIAYISCNVQRYGQIIDELSVPGHEWLNADFVRFIEENANYIPFEHPILLEICGKRFTKTEKEVIEKTIREYYVLKMGDYQDDVALNRKRTALLLVLGIVSIAVYVAFLILDLNTVITEIMSIVVWFFIWEAGDTLLYDHNEIMYNKMVCAQMESMAIRFEKKFDETPVDDEDAEKIIEEVLQEEETPVYEGEIERTDS